MLTDASLYTTIASELQARVTQVQAAIGLLDGGATVAFIARYRKEATGGLTDEQLRLLQQRLDYLRELQQRKKAILQAIDKQAKLTPQLAEKINQAPNKQELEDLYLPYKLKRRTKAQIAAEAGLAPLAAQLWQNPNLDPATQAANFIRPASAFDCTELVLAGVTEIFAEQWSEQAAVLQQLRDWLWRYGILQASLKRGQDATAAETVKFSDYFDYQEPIHKVPSHRALALFRALKNGVLTLKLLPPDSDSKAEPSQAQQRLAQQLNWRHSRRCGDDFIQQSIAWAWQHKLAPVLERNLLSRLKDSAEAQAIKVFAENLRHLLLAAPAGAKTVLGLDPGIRTGVKLTVVAASGELLAATTIYPHPPRQQWQQSAQVLADLISKHQVELIAIGNGTGSRETEQLVAEVIRQGEAGGKKMPQSLVISEAGASVYSASAYASQELPQLDVSLRGAVSIARRLQDPLAELVKIEPKAIGVGQYQHDVNQTQLSSSLAMTVEDCVNAVGVDLNTASVALLQHISGLSAKTAAALVQFRQDHAGFNNRRQLLKVAGFGAKTFEQSAGFLRIRNGDNCLDMTGVHPESYAVVEAILAKLQLPIQQVIGQPGLLAQLNPADFVTNACGEISVKDILQELAKPNRDPRPDFKTTSFNTEVQDISDLTVGMQLTGVVSNVAAFGAFVDLGVHQNGLIHISQISKDFVKDARDKLKVGQEVQVRVLQIDLPRKRIALSLRLDEVAAAATSGSSRVKAQASAAAPRQAAATAMELALAQANRSNKAK